MDHKTTIENELLLLPKHKHRLKDHVQYLADFVILPKFVWMPLKQWYGCRLELTREIITYKTPVRQSSSRNQQRPGDSLRSSYSKNFITSGQKFNQN
jgi:hypothetical protein